MLSLLVALPAVVLAVLISYYCVNIPYWDQWEEYDLFYRFQHQTLTLGYLFSQHSDHRIFFPRLLLIAASYFAPYTDLVELWISWILAVLSSVCLWRLSWRTGWATAPGLLLLASANVLLFNLHAHEDWLWGFQVGFLLPVFCVCAAVWSVSASKGPAQFIWAAIWSGINSFSIASGFVTWIILIPLLLFPEGKFCFRWRGLLLHLLGLCLCLILYFHGYYQPSDTPNRAGALSDPLGAAHWFLDYLGACIALSGGLNESLVAGLILVVIYLGCLGVLFFHRTEKTILGRTLPWLTLSHYGLCSAALTTLGRMGGGLDQSLSSRYVVFSSLLPIGLLFAGGCLFPLALSRLKSKSLREISFPLMVVLPVILCVWYVWNAWNTLAFWKETNLRRLSIQASLTFINLPSSEEALTRVAFPDFSILKQFFDQRTKLGYPQRLLMSPLLSELADLSAPDPLFGAFTANAKGPWGGEVIEGNAYLTSARRRADLVLLTLPDEQGRDSIVGMTLPSDFDPVAAREFHCPPDTLIRWSIRLLNRTDFTGLKAWIYDGVKERVYQLPGSYPPNAVASVAEWKMGGNSEGEFLRNSKDGRDMVVQKGTPLSGYIDSVGIDSKKELRLSGWVGSPVAGESCENLIFVQQSQIVLVVPVNRPRSDVAEFYKRPELAESGFEISFPESFLTNSAEPLRVFGFIRGKTPDKDRLMELNYEAQQNSQLETSSRGIKLK